MEIFFQNRINTLIFETNIDMKDYFMNQGISNSILIRTWSPDANKIECKQPDFWKEHELNSKDVMVYSGNFGFSQPIEVVLDFIKKHSKQILVLLGDGSQKNRIYKYVAENKIKNVIFHDFLAKEEYAYILKNSKFGIISLRNDIDGFSSKMTTYLAYDLPVLAFIGHNNDMHEIIDKYHCGIIINNKSSNLSHIVTSGVEYEALKNNTKKAKEIFNKNLNLNKFVKTIELLSYTKQ